MKTDPKVDAYIDKSKEFAQPVLNHLRKLVHEVCPETEEKIKWAFPTFNYKGKILCFMGAFKAHCTFGFWLGSLMQDPYGLLEQKESSAMGQFGKITSLNDLPEPRVLTEYLLEAMMLIDQGKTLPQKPKAERKEIPVPAILQEALDKNPGAREYFDSLSYSHRKEYIEYITEAKREETRLRRAEKAIALLEKNKSLNWKYSK